MVLASAKPSVSKLVFIINNLLIDLFICQTFFCQTPESVNLLPNIPLPNFPVIGYIHCEFKGCWFVEVEWSVSDPQLLKI